MRKKADKRVGILGGSFDPVHNGHIGLAAQIRKKFQLDQILFIPAYISPHKQDRGPASPHHRQAMLQLAIDPHPFFLISELELNRKEISFTVDTLSVLIDKQPDTEFFLIMGNDAFAGIKTWKSVHRVLGMCHVIVATRPGFTLEGIEENLKNLIPDSDTLFSPTIKEEEVTVFHHREKATTLNFFDLVPMEISSNVIRDRINNHRKIKNMLPLEVENYIIKNQLYRTLTHP
ncbi:MAG: nicotinate (nicotinamide) nucleotide adenylyltransferase [Nitrospinae bacterium]|nr:nicotinate (nicotinamide) nucleotide adenylyltransferase [Nitrospinota bacterium]